MLLEKGMTSRGAVPVHFGCGGAEGQDRTRAGQRPGVGGKRQRRQKGNGRRYGSGWKSSYGIACCGCVSTSKLKLSLCNSLFLGTRIWGPQENVGTDGRRVFIRVRIEGRQLMWLFIGFSRTINLFYPTVRYRPFGHAAGKHAHLRHGVRCYE